MVSYYYYGGERGNCMEIKTLKKLIIAGVEKLEDLALLDLILRLIINECIK